MPPTITTAVRRLSIPAVLAALTLAAPAAQAATPATPLHLTPTGAVAHQSIIGGYTPSPGAWPWMTAVAAHPSVARGNDYDRQFCGGTLVHPRVVVTAAHCVTEEDGSSTAAARLQAITGKELLSADGGEHLDVLRVERHPRYDAPTHRYDVALLYLDAPSSSTPAALVWERSSIATGTRLTVMGWGGTLTGLGDRGYSDPLKAADLALWSDRDCATATTAWSGNASLYDPATMLCAGWSDAIDSTCKGDSGGPLMLRDTSGAWRLFGVVSFGKPDCDKRNAPSVFAWLGADTLRSFVANGIAAAGDLPPAGSAAASQSSPATTAPTPTVPSVTTTGDTVAPRLGAVRATPRVVRRGRAPRIVFRASETATVEVRLRGPRGLRASGIAYARPGTVRLRVPRRLGRTRLTRGSWRVELRLRDAAGNRSRARSTTFRIAR
jgi:secreted trypsin-like serine protease